MYFSCKIPNKAEGLSVCNLQPTTCKHSVPFICVYNCYNHLMSFAKINFHLQTANSSCKTCKRKTFSNLSYNCITIVVSLLRGFVNSVAAHLFHS